MSQDAFDRMVARFRARMAHLRETHARQGYLYAEHQKDSGYAILLTPEPSGDATWRVTSFQAGQPIGHRQYDVLEGRGPAFNALQEFAGTNWRLVQRYWPPTDPT
jgi:hypothetical protein